MIAKLGQVMVYVNDQEAVAAFWIKTMGFVERSRMDNGQGFKFIEVAPSAEAETSLVLHSKSFVAKMAPELNLGTPSLMFYEKNLAKLHSDLKAKGVRVGDLVDRPGGRSFNFPDVEGNYFAVTEW